VVEHLAFNQRPSQPSTPSNARDYWAFLHFWPNLGRRHSRPVFAIGVRFSPIWAQAWEDSGKTLARRQPKAQQSPGGITVDLRIMRQRVAIGALGARAVMQICPPEQCLGFS
jgi:hypothetical protein